MASVSSAGVAPAYVVSNVSTSGVATGQDQGTAEPVLIRLHRHRADIPYRKRSGAATVTTRLDFAEFYAASFGRITAQLHAYIGDHAEAQDMVQEAFCRAYAHWSTVSTYDNPLAWVRRIAWNMAVSRWRRARLLRAWRRDLVADPLPEPSAASVDLARALAKLPPNQRQALVLHYLADMSVADIAAFVGVAEGTVKAWLHRGRTTLGGLMAENVDAAATRGNGLGATNA
jgi:RNA polymerase sigma-70 factor (ECF subfamily)